MSDNVSKINNHTSEVVAKLATDLAAMTSRAATKEDIANLVKDIAEFKAYTEEKLLAITAAAGTKAAAKKKTEASAAETSGEAPIPAAAPAAAAKAKKPVGASAWFKDKYKSDEAFRNRIDALPEAVARLAQPDAAQQLAKKRTENTRVQAKGDLISELAELVKREFDAANAANTAVPEAI